MGARRPEMYDISLWHEGPERERIHVKCCCSQARYKTTQILSEFFSENHEEPLAFYKKCTGYERRNNDLKYAGVTGGLVGHPCAYKSISRVQFSPSAHTRRDFFLHQKMMSGKRDSVNSMKIDEQWEC